MVAEIVGDATPGLVLFRALGERGGDGSWFSLRERYERNHFLRKKTRAARRATPAVGCG